jgi:hypothetical protein
MAKSALRTDAAIVFALFALNLLILGPYLLTDFPNQAWNNGYMYIGMARAFHDYFGGWNPSTYAGAPLRYLYPPVFPGLLGLFAASPGHAYHLLTGIAFALIPAAVYALGVELLGSRLLGAFAAIVYSAFPSPVYYFLPTWKALAQPFASAPWGFLALLRYEEAPHGFSFLFAILAILAAVRNRWIWASIFSAAVFLTSWPGTVGLAMALLAVTLTGGTKSAIRLLTTGGMAYGLAAFWMTPGFFLSTSILNRVVLSHNVAIVPWTRTTWLIAGVAAALAGVALWRLPRMTAAVVCWSAITGAVIVAYTLTNAALVPLPYRYMLEFNLCVVLLLSAMISLIPRWRGVAVVVVLLAGAPGAIHFLRHAWGVQPHFERPESSASYPIAQWLGEHRDGARVMASGELEPALSVWTRVPQVGGSGQGVSNTLVFAAQRQIAFGCGVDSEKIAERWMQALGVDNFAVHGAASREYFHWIADPAKFSRLPVSWQNGADDTIYKLTAGPQAVVVDLDGLKKLPPMQSTSDVRFLDAYVAWAAGKRPVEMLSTSASRADFDVELNSGEAILVKTNYDRGWHAEGAFVEADPIGFLLVDAAPGRRHVALKFGAAWDTWLGIAITVITIALLVVRAPGILTAAIALAPAVAGYVVLASATPHTVAVAEQAFARLQPPTINPEGIVDAATNAQPPFQRGRPLTVYGLNFGAPTDNVLVLAGDRPATVEYRGLNQINFRLPPNVPARVPISVEVNGCRGNAFSIDEM